MRWTTWGWRPTPTVTTVTEATSWVLSGTGGQSRTAAVRTSTATERVRRTREPSPYVIEADEARITGRSKVGCWGGQTKMMQKFKQKKIFSQDIMILRILVYFIFNTSQYSECLLSVSIKSIDQSWGRCSGLKTLRVFFTRKHLSRAVGQRQVIASSWLVRLLASSWCSPPGWVT